ARLPAVPQAKAQRGVRIDRVDGVEFREIDGRELRRAIQTVELENVVGVFAAVGPLEVHPGLDDMPQTIEPPRTRLHLFEALRPLRRYLKSGIHDRTEHRAALLQ